MAWRITHRLPNLFDHVTLRPRQVPVTEAVIGAYSIVHMVLAGVIRPGSPATRARGGPAF